MQFRLLLILTALSGCGGDPLPKPLPKPSADDGWKVSIISPATTDQLVVGSTLTCRIRLHMPKNATAPSAITASFLRGEALAGEFLANPPKLVPAEGGESTCELQIKVPAKPGKYRFKVKVHRDDSTSPPPTAESQLTVS